MVRLVDLNDEGSETFDSAQQWSHQPRGGDNAVSDAIGNTDDRPNPNLDHGFAAALSCYPFISQLAKDVDLNTLHELSRTCRQFRANLLQHRTQLIEQTLRCEFDTATVGQRLGHAFNNSMEQWTTFGRNGVQVGRISSGKVGACARDLVGECRNCSKVVCRNCVHKPQGANIRKGRHRRLCRTCMKCPLPKLTTVIQPPEYAKPSPPLVSPANPIASDNEPETRPRQPTFTRTPCTCDHSVWLCQPCGHTVRAADTTYARGWNWRNRYSVCGGLGAGLGEGNEGVECGRRSDCLDASRVIQEIECDGDGATPDVESGRAGSPGRQWAGSGYLTREVVGIGGRVKRAVKRLHWVGAVVKEYEDERVEGRFLQREQEGVNRSWCSWCARVVVGKRDVGRATASTDSVDSASSSGDSTR